MGSLKLTRMDPEGRIFSTEGLLHWQLADTSPTKNNKEEHTNNDDPCPPRSVSEVKVADNDTPLEENVTRCRIGDGGSVTGECRVNTSGPSNTTLYSEASAPVSEATTVYSPIGDEDREAC
jgi:hypothetical protein